MSTQYVLIFTQIDSFTVHLWKFTCFLENRSRVVKSVHTWTLILSISVLFFVFFFRRGGGNVSNPILVSIIPSFAPSSVFLS